MSDEGEEQQENQEYEDGEEEEMELTPSQMEQMEQMMLQQQEMEEGEEYGEEDYGEEGEYGEEMEYGEVEEGEEGEEGEYGEDEENYRDQEKEAGDGFEIFENDEPAHEDLIRKVRRDLLENLNRERKDKDLAGFHLELMLHWCAKDYAQHICESGEPDQLYWEEYIIKQYYQPLLKEKEKQFPMDCHLCHIIANYEEEADVNVQTIYDYFVETGYLFLEVEEDKQFLLSSGMNHIGIGVQFDPSRIVIVLAIAKRALAITRISDGEGGCLEIRGKVLEDKQGLYSVKVIDNQQNSQNTDITKIGPEKIEYSKATKEFLAIVEGVETDKQFGVQKLVEFWNRQNPESIPYKKQSREKLNFKYLDPQMKIPCFAFPDPKFAAEDEAERQRVEKELVHIREEERRMNEEKEKRFKESLQEDEEQKRSQDDDDEEDQESQVQLEDQLKRPEQKEPVISNREIRDDLETAIAEAQRQHEEFSEIKRKLEEKIKILIQKNDLYRDKTNEMAMNEHKYLNTLAHVHQIRLDLKQTQERYNKMAFELQQKLEEKQKKCQEIKLAFLELKREVAKKAANSRNDKPIPSSTIDDWEDKELQKGKVLQELRLDILRLRNQYVKNQKILKKKEELAEGLHLIDFEQLKIENQTLNEKIEERNEDLHKLKKKNTTTVQILTHTREKLGFIKKKNDQLKEQDVKCETELNELREKLSKAKKAKDETKATMQKFKQKTGIVRSNVLKNDFEKLFNKVKELEEEKLKLKQKLENMQSVILEHKKQQAKADEAMMSQK